ncbi:MAG: hypothetical protein ACI4L1_02135 [Christensenellales bacterium]
MNSQKIGLPKILACKNFWEEEKQTEKRKNCKIIAILSKKSCFDVVSRIRNRLKIVVPPLKKPEKSRLLGVSD